MRVIIAGWRDYCLGLGQRAWLDKLNATMNIEEVISGAASGADLGGERWARSRNIPVKRFYANWDLHGRAAGPIRNTDMARYVATFLVDGGGACILFPGGRGTDHMRSAALDRKIPVFEYAELADAESV